MHSAADVRHTVNPDRRTMPPGTTHQRPGCCHTDEPGRFDQMRDQRRGEQESPPSCRSDRYPPRDWPERTTRCSWLRRRRAGARPSRTVWPTTDRWPGPRRLIDPGSSGSESAFAEVEASRPAVRRSGTGDSVCEASTTGLRDCAHVENSSRRQRDEPLATSVGSGGSTPLDRAPPPHSRRPQPWRNLGTGEWTDRAAAQATARDIDGGHARNRGPRERQRATDRPRTRRARRRDGPDRRLQRHRHGRASSGHGFRSTNSCSLARPIEPPGPVGAEPLDAALVYPWLSYSSNSLPISQRACRPSVCTLEMARRHPGHEHVPGHPSSP